MNITEHMKVIVAEELGELIEACIKAQKKLHKNLRFGDNDINPDTNTVNLDGLILEARDVISVIEMLVETTGYDEILNRDLIEQKKCKVRAMIAKSTIIHD